MNTDKLIMKRKLVCLELVANKQTSIDVDSLQQGDNFRDSCGYFVDAAVVVTARRRRRHALRSSSLFFPPSLRSCRRSFAAAAVVVSFVGKAVLRLMSSQLRHLFYSSQ